MNAVTKALIIIEDLAVFGPSSITQISKRLAMDVATVHRNLNTLRERGFVIQSSWDRYYHLSERLAQLGSLENKREALLSLTRPVIERLSEKFKETVYVAAYVESGQAINLDTIFGTYGPTLRVTRSRGFIVYMHASSLGKCLLAFSDDYVLEAVLPKLKLDRFTDTTITGLKAFRKELMQIRYQGYALDNGETKPDTYCVGVPVFDRYGGIWAAVSVSGSKKRILYKRPEIIKDLKGYSKEMSLNCGLPESSWRIPEG